MAKKKKTNRDIYSSTADNEKYGRLYESCVLSPAFQNLSCLGKTLYMYCLLQAKTEQSNRCLYMHSQEYGTKYKENNHFVFPAYRLEEFGIKRQNSTKYFNELEKAGFIDVVEHNHRQHRPNVYRFSERWKDSS